MKGVHFAFLIMHYHYAMLYLFISKAQRHSSFLIIKSNYTFQERSDEQAL